MVLVVWVVVCVMGSADEVCLWCRYAGLFAVPCPFWEVFSAASL